MKVTFISNSRVLGYRPGQIVEADLDPMLEGLLRTGRHLTLIDPPSLDYFEAQNGNSASTSDSEKRRSSSRKSDGQSDTSSSGISEGGASEYN